MKAAPFVVTPKDYDPALNVLGIKVTVGFLPVAEQINSGELHRWAFATPVNAIG